MKKALLMTLLATTFALPALAATDSRPVNPTPVAMTKTYNKADLNKDGKVTPQELKAEKKAEMAAKKAEAHKSIAPAHTAPSTNE